jgi:hypothetical protein
VVAPPKPRADGAGRGGFLDGGKAERLRAGGEPVRQAEGGRGGEARQEEDDGRGGGSCLRTAQGVYIVNDE